jgi:IS30 family transposase
MKKKQYKQLTEKEREKLFDYQRRGLPQRKMAHKLKRHVSTISRELSRNRHKLLDCYLPDTACRKSFRRKANGRKKKYLKKDPRLETYVLEKLKLGWTPELISGRMKRDIGLYVNYETIYQYIYSLKGRLKNLRQYLPRSHRIRQKKHGRKHHRGKIPNRIDISERPKAVEKREEFGHWEGDSLVYRGHSQVLATHAERKSRYLLLGQPEDRTAAARRVEMVALFKDVPEWARRSMTVDNGSEFSEHESFSKKVGMAVYFAKPYAAWQRGTNEHINELVRRYLPRTTDVRRLGWKKILRVQDMINDRPMKCLGFDTPRETLVREMQKLYPQKFRKAA